MKQHNSTELFLVVNYLTYFFFSTKISKINYLRNYYSPLKDKAIRNIISEKVNLQPGSKKNEVMEITKINELSLLTLTNPLNVYLSLLQS